MKTICRVAGTELRTLFYSPIAWLLLIVFYIQVGIVYLGRLEIFTGMQDRGGEELKSMGFLTFQVFGEPQGGVLTAVMRNVFLYLPLLTMGLLSKETSSGTIKLLYSSPIRVRSIVFGKYLSMLLFGLLMAALVGVYLFSGVVHIQQVDVNTLWSSLLGFYLLLCTYSAIGLFMSSLTTYQVIAAICSFAMFAFLSYIGTMWQRVEFVREITYYLSINGRASNMTQGLITTRDLLYFASIIFIFLGLTIYRLRAGTESKSLAVRVTRYASVVVTGIAVIFFSSLPALTGYWDVSAGKMSTLTPNAQKVVKELKEAPLEVQTYNNILGRLAFYGMPEYRKMINSNWDMYLRFNSNMSFTFMDHYDEPLDTYQPFFEQYPNKTLQQVAEQFALGMQLDLKQVKSPAQISKRIDLKPELNRYVMLLKWKDRSTYLRLFDDPQVWPSETEVSAAFKRLTGQRMPKVLFTTGNLERDIYKSGGREYGSITSKKTFREALVNQGFDTDTITPGARPIPADIAMLVLADPKTALSPAAITSLEEFIDTGGNLLIAGEPGKQALLNPLLHKIGVQLMDGIIVQPSERLSPDLALLQVTPTAQLFTTKLSNRIKEDSLRVGMPGATGVAIIDSATFKSTPLLVSDGAASWLKAGNTIPDSIALSFNGAQGDQRGSLATAVALTRRINNKEQRIIVMGDADFMSNANLSRFDIETANFEFNTALFSWLDNGEYPIDTSRPPSKDKRVSVNIDSLDKMYILYLWVVPAIMIAAGSIILLRRKRK